MDIQTEHYTEKRKEDGGYNRDYDINVDIFLVLLSDSNHTPNTSCDLYYHEYWYRDLQRGF